MHTVCPHLSVSIRNRSRNLLSRCQAACGTVFTEKIEKDSEYIGQLDLCTNKHKVKRYLPELCLGEISPFVQAGD